MNTRTLLGWLGGAALFLVGALVLPQLRQGAGELVRPTGEQAAYVGLWHGADGRRLRLYPDGSVDYHSGALGRRITEAAARFEGDALVVVEGASVVRTTLRIGAPPHVVGDRVVMTLDGVEFVRDGRPPAPPSADAGQP